ncbi:MarR family winged helix-turn-helix transcriptional regulator [Saccharibacillus sacchari]|uniref:MarR family winged helix-turn-helix transcriptional regulator n=1 Tax=Saccharibacillus sacchari TaxID=456493 RepID=UPI0004AE3028|nr:MarR family winged helix-turn-helix transcriptional regulator [Saccharibacillus sacchari]
MKEVLREVEAIARCSEAISSIEFKHLKLSRGLHLYLTFICENPGEPAGTVPDRLKVKRAAASRALQKLEDEGLVVLREAPNLRKDKRVYPTETGKSAYLFIQDEGEYSDESSLRGLSPDETAQLLDMLYRVRLNVEKDWRFVQKGGRRPYIHEYYNRLIAAESQEQDLDDKRQDAESSQENAQVNEPFSEQKESAEPARQVSLWTYEESAEQDAKRNLEGKQSEDRKPD